MMTKHFFKTLAMFSGIIALGLLGAFLVSSFGKDDSKIEATGSTTQVAK